MEHLLAAWPEVTEQLRQAKQILLLTDFDGTLIPIVERPEQVQVPESTRLLLQVLAYQRRLKLGIISGRALTDLKEKVNVRGIVYAGNHGFEIEGPGLSFVYPLAEEIRPFFRLIAQLLIRALNSTKGVFVENKGITLSVHYRQMAKESFPKMHSSFNKIINGALLDGKFKVTSGKKVFELRPDVDWDKGKAINLLMRKLGKGRNSLDFLPIYMGDDLTDEDGFEAIMKHGQGITVHIGNDLHQTSANYYLKSSDEVLQFLKTLLRSIQRGFR